MTVRSAGILLCREGPAGTEVWIAHMGGPFWARKDEGAWSIPKGLIEQDDVDELAAARREFAEEMGAPAPEADYELLGEFAAAGKTIVVFAAEAAFDPVAVESNLFELEWPPRSGRVQQFPEVDAAGWYPVADARRLLAHGQRSILDALRAEQTQNGSSPVPPSRSYGGRESEGGAVAKKKAEKEAEKALATARAAVYEAQRLVKKLDKKTRKGADELAAALEQTAKDARKAVKRAKRTAGTAATTAKEQVETVRTKTAEVSVPATSIGIPTFRDLRDRAKEQGIQGYSRMNKAQLLHALDEG